MASTTSTHVPYVSKELDDKNTIIVYSVEFKRTFNNILYMAAASYPDNLSKVGHIFMRKDETWKETIYPQLVRVDNSFDMAISCFTPSFF